MYTQVVLIFILIDVQYLQNAVFSFEESSNGQNHSSSSFHHPIKNSRKISHPLLNGGISPTP